MAFIEQICDGYGKRTLLGNWQEERLYPKQPFRDNVIKQARSREEAIACFDGRSFQRPLPRLERRVKWETANRVILNDGVPSAPTVMKAEYPHGEFQATTGEAKRPFNKCGEPVDATSIHPHSVSRPAQKNYHILSRNNAEEMHQQRAVSMYKSDFSSSLPQHPAQVKFTNYVSEHKNAYPEGYSTSRNRTMSEFHRSTQHAGKFNQAPLESVKPITTLTCQNWKENADVKQRTTVQRSWVPSRDKAVSYSMGCTAESFRVGSRPANDIQTNVNMNIGVNNLHPRAANDNFFRHVRQDVTVAYNKTFSSRP